MSEDEKLKEVDRFSYLVTMVGALSPADQKQMASEIAQEIPFREDFGFSYNGVYDKTITHVNPYESGQYERSLRVPLKDRVNQARADLSK